MTPAFEPEPTPGRDCGDDAARDAQPRRALEPMSAEDEATIEAQLGRMPRGVAGVAWRCPCGKPGVVATRPRLPQGTPFPTTYYLTCPRATSAVSTLEANGMMAEMSERLTTDAELAASYRRAHESYLADREALGDVPEIRGISAGGMPSRVKCLHVLVGHSLAVGPGVNPLGDEAVEAIGPFWQRPCLADRPAPPEHASTPTRDASTPTGNASTAAGSPGTRSEHAIPEENR